MRGYKNALYAEILKAHRSRMFLISILAFSLIPLVGGLFMLILKNPDFAERIGLLAAKAQLTAGSADWPAYIRVVSMATAMGGLVLFSLIAIWVFGREYSDRTMKDILSLPTSRSEIVAAKFTLIASWSVALSVLTVLLCFAIGAAVNIPKWSASLAWNGVADIAVSFCLAMLLVPPVAFIASFGRGYFPPMGFTVLTLVVAMIFGNTGWGKYVPWSIPMLYSGATGGAGGKPVTVSFIIVALTGIAGAAATFYWWRNADQTR